MIANSDFKLAKSSTVATSFSTANVGGGIGALSVASLGDTFFNMTANGSGGGDLFQYAKVFDKNDHASLPASNYGIYSANWLDDLSGNDLLGFSSSSALDVHDLLLVGYSSGGAPQSETITLNGTTQVNSSFIFGATKVRIISPTQTVANGPITITHNGSTIGIIPVGMWSATNEIDMGLESAIDDTNTIADASTAPAGVAFTRTRTETAKLLVAGGTGTLPSQSAQGIWLRWTLAEQMISSPEFQPFGLVGAGDG